MAVIEKRTVEVPVTTTAQEERVVLELTRQEASYLRSVLYFAKETSVRGRVPYTLLHVENELASDFHRQLVAIT